MLRIIERQEQILQHLGEPETLRVVDLVGITGSDIVDIVKAHVTCRRFEEFLEGFDRTGGTLEEGDVACGAPRVEV